MPEQEKATRLFMAWAELYIRLRSVCPTWDDISLAFLEYAPNPPPPSRIWVIWPNIDLPLAK